MGQKAGKDGRMRMNCHLVMVQSTRGAYAAYAQTFLLAEDEVSVLSTADGEPHSDASPHLLARVTFPGRKAPAKGYFCFPFCCFPHLDWGFGFAFVCKDAMFLQHLPAPGGQAWVSPDSATCTCLTLCFPEN